MLPFVNLFRNWLYDHGYFKAQKVSGTFVISIGNLTYGGTGKTPLAIELLKKLGAETVALVTRGYGGRYDKKDLPLEVQSDSDPRNVGDEPLLIKRSVPQSKVIVDPDRVRGAQLAKRPIVVLDDGMQHRRLARDFEIVVVDGENPFPFFRLREFPSSLRRADVVVVMGGTYTPDRPFVRMKRKFVGKWDEKGLAGKKVGLFCGVGRPGQVEQGLKLAGAEVVERWFLPDHATPAREKLDDFIRSCENRKASVVLCTEKDWVKLPSESFSIEVAPLLIQLEILEGQDIWEKAIVTCKRAIE